MHTGIERVRNAFQQAQQTQTAALMPYFTLGYPDHGTALEAIEAVAQHSDLLELGVPFSDPVADGPTIQRSTQRSLEAGTSVATCLEGLATLRSRGVNAPVMLMGYYNPILAYGSEQYVRDARDAGAQGLIVPDLPPEEADEVEQHCIDQGMAYIFMLAPTSDPQRVAAVARRARGFIYMVSVTGVTGARSKLRQGLDTFVADVRQRADAPVAVGFGISSPEQAAAVGEFADGVIVGSALINAFDNGGISAAEQFAQSLRQSLRHNDKLSS